MCERKAPRLSLEGTLFFPDMSFHSGTGCESVSLELEQEGGVHQTGIVNQSLLAVCSRWVLSPRGGGGVRCGGVACREVGEGQGQGQGCGWACAQPQAVRPTLPGLLCIPGRSLVLLRPAHPDPARVCGMRRTLGRAHSHTRFVGVRPREPRTEGLPGRRGLACGFSGRKREAGKGLRPGCLSDSGHQGCSGCPLGDGVRGGQCLQGLRAHARARCSLLFTEGDVADRSYPLPKLWHGCEAVVWQEASRRGWPRPWPVEGTQRGRAV